MAAESHYYQAEKKRLLAGEEHGKCIRGRQENKQKRQGTGFSKLEDCNAEGRKAFAEEATTGFITV